MWGQQPHPCCCHSNGRCFNSTRSALSSSTSPSDDRKFQLLTQRLTALQPGPLPASGLSGSGLLLGFYITLPSRLLGFGRVEGRGGVAGSGPGAKLWFTWVSECLDSPRRPSRSTCRVLVDLQPVCSFIPSFSFSSPCRLLWNRLQLLHSSALHLSSASTSLQKHKASLLSCLVLAASGGSHWSVTGQSV